MQGDRTPPLPADLPCRCDVRSSFRRTESLHLSRSCRHRSGLLRSATVASPRNCDHCHLQALLPFRRRRQAPRETVRSRWSGSSAPSTTAPERRLETFQSQSAASRSLRVTRFEPRNQASHDGQKQRVIAGGFGRAATCSGGCDTPCGSSDGSPTAARTAHRTASTHRQQGGRDRTRPLYRHPARPDRRSSYSNSLMAATE
jgi:hypothetical protein